MGIAPDGKDFHFNVIPVLKLALLVLDSQVAMSPNANVFIIFAMSLFLTVHEFLRKWLPRSQGAENPMEGGAW